MNRFKSILDGVELADRSPNENGYNYYGYVRHNGEWIIIREKIDNTEYRYKVGADNYVTNWNNHVSLKNYSRPILG